MDPPRDQPTSAGSRQDDYAARDGRKKGCHGKHHLTEGRDGARKGDCERHGILNRPSNWWKRDSTIDSLGGCLAPISRHMGEKEDVDNDMDDNGNGEEGRTTRDRKALARVGTGTTATPTSPARHFPSIPSPPRPQGVGRLSHSLCRGCPFLSPSRKG